MKKEDLENNEFPLVSIWTLVYNTGSYVIESLKAIQNQTYPLDRIQHIIIDDCSTDHSVTLVENWIKDNNYKCTFLKHKENQGICKTLNEAINLIEGVYCIGSSDDLLEENTIKKYVEALGKSDDTIGLVTSNMKIIDEKSNIVSTSYFSEENLSFIKKGGKFFNMLIDNYFIPAPSTMYKTHVFQKVGVFDESLEVEDFDFHLRLAKEFEFVFIDETLVRYRIHGKNFSNSYGSPKNLEMTQYCLLKHFNDSNLDRVSKLKIAEALKRNLDKAYRFNYSIFFRIKLYIGLFIRSKETSLTISILYKTLKKNLKRTIKKIVR